jgi:malonyl CoA-acyl carrier protein transacylase
MVRRMVDLGVDRFLEIGSGRVLTGLVARIGRRLDRANLSSLTDVSEALRFATGEDA